MFNFASCNHLLLLWYACQMSIDAKSFFFNNDFPFAIWLSLPMNFLNFLVNLSSPSVISRIYCDVQPQGAYIRALYSLRKSPHGWHFKWIESSPNECCDNKIDIRALFCASVKWLFGVVCIIQVDFWVRAKFEFQSEIIWIYKWFNKWSLWHEKLLLSLKKMYDQRFWTFDETNSIMFKTFEMHRYTQ